MQNEKNNINEENIEIQNNNDEQKINKNINAEMDYETLKKEYERIYELYDNISNRVNTQDFLYENIYLSLLLYAIIDFNQKSEADKKQFCKLLNINPEMLKDYIKNFCKLYNQKIKKLEKSISKNTQNGKVGYGNPPVETRFQKGNKGNPKGRKPKKDANLLDLLADELTKRIAINKNGKKKTVYKKELVIQQMLNQLMTGARVPKNNINIIQLMDKYSNSKKSLMRRFGLK